MIRSICTNCLKMKHLHFGTSWRSNQFCRMVVLVLFISLVIASASSSVLYSTPKDLATSIFGLIKYLFMITMEKYSRILLYKHTEHLSGRAKHKNVKNCVKGVKKDYSLHVMRSLNKIVISFFINFFEEHSVFLCHLPYSSNRSS